MFGWLIGGEVNDDAIRLKTLTDIVVDKYLPLDTEELANAIRHDLPPENYNMDRFEAMFQFDSAPYFMFRISLDKDEIELSKGLVVLGTGKYAGFSLSYNSGLWLSSIRGGVTGNVTGGAKKLSKVMEKKFGVQDMEKELGIR